MALTRLLLIALAFASLTLVVRPVAAEDDCAVGTWSVLRVTKSTLVCIWELRQ